MYTHHVMQTTVLTNLHQQSHEFCSANCKGSKSTSHCY